MLRLELRHWQMLLAISEQGTLRQAASHLGVTQPALSHRLAEAERRLGGELFNREGRQLVATQAGQTMIETARQILPVLDRAEQDFELLANSQKSLVRFGVAAYSFYHWLPEFVGLMHKRLPDLELELVARATLRPVASLLEREVDVVMAPGHLVAPGVEAIELFQDELVLVVPTDHPLAQKPFIEAQDLIDQVYLTYSRTRQPGFEYDRFIRPSGIVPQRVNIVEMTDGIIELVASGFGVSILSFWAVSSPVAQGKVAAVKVTEQGLDLSWSALIRAEQDTGSPAHRLAQLLASWH